MTIKDILFMSSGIKDKEGIVTFFFKELTLKDKMKVENMMN